MYTLYLFHILSTVQQSRVSWALSVRKAGLRHNSLLQKFRKQPVVLLGIHTRNLNMKISEGLGVNLRTDSYWGKPNTQLTLLGLGWWWCYTLIYLPTWPQTQCGGSSAWKRQYFLRLRRWLLEDSKSGNKILHHATQSGESSVGC